MEIMAMDQDQPMAQRLEELERDLRVCQQRIKWRTVALLVMITLLGAQAWWHVTLAQRLLRQTDALSTVFDGHPTLNLTPKTVDPRDLGAAMLPVESSASLPHRP
jgi:hypothetical protein